MDEMQPEIQNIIDFTNTTFNLNGNAKENMCLKNHYKHKRHCIGEHSDDEKEMGCLADVFCYCVGSGELILRAHKSTFSLKFVKFDKEFNKNHRHENS